MVIGREEPKHARQTDLKAAIRIGLDECITALEECIHDLTDLQMWKIWPIEGKHNIGTLVMHLLGNLNGYGCAQQGGRALVEDADWRGFWRSTPEENRESRADVPGVGEVVELLHRTRDNIFAILNATTDEQLRAPRPDSPWFERFPDRVAADAYMRTIMHTMGHTRQIWALRGAMGAAGGDAWPLQHWA